jgi:hypothetical protein
MRTNGTGRVGGIQEGQRIRFFLLFRDLKGRLVLFIVTVICII